MSLRDLLGALARRKMAALLTFALVFGAVVLLTLSTPPTYRSTARLLLENQDKTGVDPLTQIFGSQARTEIENQIQLILSPLLLNRVYEKAGVPPGSVQLNAERVTGGSNVVELTALSRSKTDVEKFITTLPEVYRDNRRNDRLREVSTQLSFAEKDLKDQTRNLQQLESAWTNFKNSRGIVDVDAEATDALGSLSKSKSDLGTARATISSLQAQITALQADLNDLPAFIVTPVTTTNQQVEALRNQLADLRSERAQLGFLYKENADPMRENARKIRDMEARIARTPATLTTTERSPNPAVTDTRNKIASVQADLQAQQAAATVLQRQIVDQEAGLEGFTQIQREGAQLKRQLEAAQDATKAGVASVRDLSVRAKALDAVGAPVTILQEGGPGVKVSPKMSRNVAVGIFLGALLACAVALVLDSFDDRLRDEESARQMLGVPALGYFPLTAMTSENQVLDLRHPDRIMLETFRALRSNVQFALVGSGGKKLQVTSSVPNEGKSYIASNLAITMALDGKRVVLVDADLHRPTMHERLGGKRQPGLSNVLVGEVALKDALQSGGMKGLTLLSSGALPPNPAELLNSSAMSQVLRELEAQADLVIIDAPPLLATSDAQLLSSKVDGVIFVMQVGSVPRSGTLRAFELLQQAHANLLGVVFNKVKANKNSNFEYYSGYYTLESNAFEEQLQSNGNGRSLRGSVEEPAELSHAERNGTSEHNGDASKEEKRRA